MVVSVLSQSICSASGCLIALLVSFFCQSDCWSTEMLKENVKVPAYITVNFTPIHEESLKQYIAAVPATLMQYEGRFLIRGRSEYLSGNTDYEMQVIIEFPSKKHALDWYYSQEYQALIPLRDNGMRSQFQLIGSQNPY